MKYLCLIYYDEQRVDALTDEQWQALVARCLSWRGAACQRAYARRGTAAVGAHGSHGARVRDGITSVVDGPLPKPASSWPAST